MVYINLKHMKKESTMFKFKKQIPVINLHGTIGKGKNSLSLENCNKSIEKAFNMNTDTVFLSINSPGGSPVQSDLIATRIRNLANKHKVHVIAFCEDVAASGGYWLACSADEIYARPCSIVGSIGVISASFGFQDLIEKWGIERRVISSGNSKSRLDPFEDLKKDDVEKLKAVQSNIHEKFIQHVKTHRPNLSTDEDLFNGDFWTGENAVKNGLVDGIDFMYDHYDDVKLKIFSTKTSFLQKIQSGDALINTSNITNDIATELTNNLEWNKFGL